jgi:hypothetical protein
MSFDYDPQKPPAPEDWRAATEEERLAAVRRHHEAAELDVPNERLHAALHVVVENQAAEGFAGVRETLERLMQGGVSRHDAVHAIGTVVARHMQALLQSGGSAFDVDSYRADLDRLGS